MKAVTWSINEEVDFQLNVTEDKEMATRKNMKCQICEKVKY